MVQQTEREAAAPAVAHRVRDLRSEVADPQVVEKAKRRRFSASYKLKILEEVDRHPEKNPAPSSGARGFMLAPERVAQAARGGGATGAR
jgi:hypothetical protein